MDNIFLPPKKKGEEKKLQPPDWLQFWPPAGQETYFFLWTALLTLCIPFYTSFEA